MQCVMRSTSLMSRTLRRLQPISMESPRAVLFDLDGTLIDTMGAFADVAADVLVKHHRIERARARRDYLLTSGVPFFRQLEVIAPGHPMNGRAADEFEERKLLATTDVEPTEETVQALAALRDAGIAVAVCSNNFQPQVDSFAERAKTEFALALGFGNGLAKGPTQFDKACEVLDCTRDDLVFVGDSLADAGIALETGIRFVGKLGTFKATDFARVVPDAPVISEITELLTLFV